MEVKKYNLIHRLLSVESNTNLIKYMHYAFLMDNSIKSKSKINLVYKVENDIIPHSLLHTKFDYCLMRQDEMIAYYEHNLLPGIKVKMLVDMNSKPYSITVNRMYDFAVRLAYGNIWPAGQHFSNLITIALLQEDVLTLHCASFSDKVSNKGYLVFGASNTGKSVTTFKAFNEGYQYHSEDLTVLKGNTIYTLPHISSLSDKLPDKNILLRYNHLMKAIPGINLLAPRIKTDMPFKNFLKKVDVRGTSSVNKIFILERGGPDIKRLSPKEAVRKIKILNRLEFNYDKDHIFLALSYFNRAFSVQTLYELENDLLSKLVEEVDTYLVTANDPSAYFQLAQTKILSS